MTATIAPREQVEPRPPRRAVHRARACAAELSASTLSSWGAIGGVGMSSTCHEHGSAALRQRRARRNRRPRVRLGRGEGRGVAAADREEAGGRIVQPVVVGDARASGSRRRRYGASAGSRSRELVADRGMRRLGIDEGGRQLAEDDRQVGAPRSARTASDEAVEGSGGRSSPACRSSRRSRSPGRAAPGAARPGARRGRARVSATRLS